MVATEVSSRPDAVDRAALDEGGLGGAVADVHADDHAPMIGPLTPRHRAGRPGLRQPATVACGASDSRAAGRQPWRSTALGSAACSGPAGLRYHRRRRRSTGPGGRGPQARRVRVVRAAGQVLRQQRPGLEPRGHLPPAAAPAAADGRLPLPARAAGSSPTAPAGSSASWPTGRTSRRSSRRSPSASRWPRGSISSSRRGPTSSSPTRSSRVTNGSSCSSLPAPGGDAGRAHPGAAALPGHARLHPDGAQRLRRDEPGRRDGPTADGGGGTGRGPRSRARAGWGSPASRPACGRRPAARVA